MWFADSPSLEIERQPQAEGAVVAAVALSAAVVPWLVSLSALQGALFMIAGCGLIFLACWFAGLIGVRRRVAKAIWDADGRWWLVDMSGARHAAMLASASTVLPRLMWLHWRGPLGSRHMLLWRSFYLKDAKNKGWRRLAARLRLCADPKSASPGERSVALRVGPVSGDV